MRAYIDADILIWHLRGEGKARLFFRDLRGREGCELWVGAMQRAEVLFFMKDEEREATSLLLSQFKTAPVDERVVDAASALYRRWHPSHGLDVNDALLAATVAQYGGRLFCLNKKHYPMPDIAVTKPW